MCLNNKCVNKLIKVYIHSVVVVILILCLPLKNGGSLSSLSLQAASRPLSLQADHYLCKLQAENYLPAANRPNFRKFLVISKFQIYIELI